MSHEWVVFTERPDEIEKFLFLANDELFISKNGRSHSAKWRYLAVNESIVIDNDHDCLLCKIVSCDDNIIVLNLDGTQQYCFLLNSRSTLITDCSFSKIQWYLIHNGTLDLLTDQQRNYYEEQEKLQQEQKEEKEKENINLIIRFMCVLLFMIIIASIISSIGNNG